MPGDNIIFGLSVIFGIFLLILAFAFGGGDRAPFVVDFQPSELRVARPTADDATTADGRDASESDGAAAASEQMPEPADEAVATVEPPTREAEPEAAPAEAGSDEAASTESAPAARPGGEGNLPENAHLRTNDAGIAIIKASEGLRLEAYQGPAGNWLIGYGHLEGVTPGMTITEAEAEQILRDDLRIFEDGVKRYVTVPVNENEFSAMVSIAYNKGVGGFRDTEILTRLNAGDRQGAADAFLLYDTAVINGERRVLEHLSHRRAQERELFLTPVD
ncbi:MAG: hypothetical protein Tsb0010_00300 [Parvularculaceae bacterium]